MISNFLDVALGNQNIDKVLLGNSLIWERPKDVPEDKT